MSGTGATTTDGLTELSPSGRDAYLARLGLDPVDPLPGPSPDLLADLQLAHLRAVPFENLDIDRGRGIVLDDDRLFAKVVERRRGGYCYELNSLFARLLRSLGFGVTLVSVRIPHEDGTLSPEFDHLALLVDCGVAGSPPHLADVGFGDATTVPLPLTGEAVAQDRDHRVRLVDGGDHWDYEEDRGEGWRLWYRFTTVPRHLAAFHDMNVWQQSSPDSHFTGRAICTRLTPAGRLTLSNRRLIATETGGERTERELAADEIDRVLAEEFGVVVPPAPAVDEIDPAILDNPVATLATNGPDGRPQLTAVWFGIEDGEVWLSITESTQKARNLRRDGRCTLSIFDPASPARVAEIRCWATLTPDPDHVSADRLGRRNGSDFRGFDGPDARRLRVALRAQRIVVTDVRR